MILTGKSYQMTAIFLEIITGQRCRSGLLYGVLINVRIANALLGVAVLEGKSHGEGSTMGIQRRGQHALQDFLSVKINGRKISSGVLTFAP